MATNYDLIKLWPTTSVRQRYSGRDTIIYNLGVGANVIEDAAALASQAHPLPAGT